MPKIQIEGSKYVLVDMEEEYPFGGIQETLGEDEEGLVRKKLCYQHEEQLQILNEMAVLLKGMACQQLLKLVHAEANAQGLCFFYYEYAPLTVSKWVLDMGEDLLKDFQTQLINMAGYLAKKGLKFKFDPKCVGLSKDIKIKYFLRQFALDKEGAFDNFKNNQESILQYFDDLRNSQKTWVDITRQTFNCSGIQNSWRFSLDVKSTNSDKASNVVGNHLKSRLEQAKKRSQQVLNRLKGLKAVSFKSKQSQ